MAKSIEARSINGVDMITFELSPETGLFHWNGDSSYAGYTEEELMKREGVVIE